MPAATSKRSSTRRAAALAVSVLLLLLQEAAVAAADAASARPAPPFTPAEPDDDEAASDALLFARMAGLVQARGYPLHMAPVRTTDGHRSLVFRIPRGRAEEAAAEAEAEAEAGRARERQGEAAPGAGRRRRSSSLSRSLAAAARGLWRAASVRALRLATASSSSRPKPAPATKPVVLLQHGLLGSSADFCLNEPAESLALSLADAGFDVFLANSRGNEYGRGGAAGGGPDAPSSYFWAFSYDEMAEFDLPAAVDHALSAAGARRLYLVAFSQGTTAALASLASSGGGGLGLGRGLSADKLELAVLMGPVAYAAHVGSAPLRRLADLGTDRLLLLLGAREFSPSSELLRRLGGDLCLASPQMCVSALTAICGYSPDKGDPRRIPFYLNYTPSGTSVQNVAHWAQAVRRGRSGGGGGGDDDGDGDDDDQRLGGRGGGGEGSGGGGCCGGGGNISRGSTGGAAEQKGKAQDGAGAAAAGSAARRRAGGGCFCAYDYGGECATPVLRLPRPCNQRIYGARDPPEYDLRRALRGGPPVVLVTGGRDRLADPRDAALLSAALADAGVLRALHHEPTFEHLDFLWGVKELQRVIARVIAELQGHRQEAAGAEAAAAAAAVSRR